MHFEAVYLDGKTYMFEAYNLDVAFKLAGKKGIINSLKFLIEESDNFIWKEAYARKFAEVLAYINVYTNGIPVASVPVKTTIEAYQKLREVNDIANEINRLKKIWPDAEIKVQKRYAYL